MQCLLRLQQAVAAVAVAAATTAAVATAVAVAVAAAVATPAVVAVAVRHPRRPAARRRGNQSRQLHVKEDQAEGTPPFQDGPNGKGRQLNGLRTLSLSSGDEVASAPHTKAKYLS
jgi:hypothetical protein